MNVVDQAFERVDRQLGVGLHALVALGLRNRVFELLTGHAAGHVAEHLHQAPVGVPREPLVVGRGRQADDGGVVEPDVEDRVEHARHRFPRAAADGHEQRVLIVAEALAGRLLEPLHRIGDLLLEPVGLVALAHVRDARLGGDREPRWDTILAEHPSHLGDVGALAAEQVAHLAGAFRELVDPLLRCHVGYPLGMRVA